MAQQDVNADVKDVADIADWGSIAIGLVTGGVVFYTFDPTADPKDHCKSHREDRDCFFVRTGQGYARFPKVNVFMFNVVVNGPDATRWSERQQEMRLEAELAFSDGNAEAILP